MDKISLKVPWEGWESFHDKYYRGILESAGKMVWI
jgi:hypothetical protein